MKASLAALHLREPDQEWLEQIPRTLQVSGYHFTKAGNTFRCWRAEWAVSRGALTYADGFQIRRLWIGRGRGALSALPQRIYFHDKSEVDQRPERIILNGTSRPDKPVLISPEPLFDPRRGLL